MPDINMQVFEEAQRNQLVTEVDIQTQAALDDYQVQLTNIVNPTQSQDNIVIDRNGEFLPHWNESLDFDTWVKMNMELAGKKLLMIYGNNGLSSESSGSDTFIQYHGAMTSEYIDSLDIVPTNIIYESKSRVTSASNDIRFGIGNNLIYSVDDSIIISNSSSNNLKFFLCCNDGTSSHVTEAPKFTLNQFYMLKFTNDGSNAHGYVDENEINTGVNTNLPNENSGLFMHFHIGTGEQEWSFVRKYISTEPTVIADSTPKNISTALKSLGRAG